MGQDGEVRMKKSKEAYVLTLKGLIWAELGEETAAKVEDIIAAHLYKTGTNAVVFNKGDGGIFESVELK